MHCGKLDGNTAAGRVYRELGRRARFPNHDGWTDSWLLTTQCYVAALSTRISEIRHQLAADPERGEAVEHKQVGRQHYYRLVKRG